MKTELLSLSDLQLAEKLQHEAVIRSGIQTFKEVGESLAAILAKRLYADEYRSFDEYVQKKWSISRPRAYQLIDAAEVIENVSTVVDIQNERVARELATLPKHDQVIVAKKLLASGVHLTAEKVRAEVVSFKNAAAPAKVTKVVDPPILTDTEKKKVMGILSDWWETNRSTLLAHPTIKPEALMVCVMNLFQ